MPVASQSPAAALPARHGFVALGAALLVLALTIFASSPVLHHWLHQGAGEHAPDGCAVVLFASGVTLATAAIAIASPTFRPTPVVRPFASAPRPSSPRFLLLPGRAPPVW